MKINPKYTLVIPVYNEAKILEDTINTVYSFLSSHNYGFELIIADDGSADNSLGIITHLKKQYPHLLLVQNQHNQGRGSVLTKAFSIAKGDILLYIDADLAIDYHLFERLTEALEEGYDIATCSKHIPGSYVEYPFLRRIASKVYSRLVRALFGIHILDYQCGFKAFRKEVITQVLPTIKSKGWSWDTEILIKSHLVGYSIKEIPATVVNVYERESTIHLIKDSWAMGTYALKLFWQLKIKKKL